MSIWDKIKGGYNWVDQNLAKGRLPGGTIPGINTPTIGSRVGDPSQYTGSYSPAGSLPSTPGAPFGMPPGAGGGGGGPADPIAGGFMHLPGTGGTPDPTGGDMSIGRRVGQFITKNPNLVLGGLGAAASIYGAHEQGQQADKQLALDTQAQQDSTHLAQEGLDQRQTQMDREYQAAQDEKERRRRAYQEVLQMRAGQQPAQGAPPPPPANVSPGGY